MAEITDRESFESWLEDKPNKWAQVLAMRSALRVLPLVGQVFDAESVKLDTKQESTLSFFRATSISWAACNYPSYDVTFSAEAAANSARANVFDAILPAIHAAIAAGEIASSGGSAIFTAIDAADAVYAVVRDDTLEALTTANATYKGNFADDILLAIDATVFAATAADTIWKRINQDATFLELGVSAPEELASVLADQALWAIDIGIIATPNWALIDGFNLEQVISRLNNNWHVWTEWYQSRLDGKESWGLNAINAKLLMLRIADRNNDWWEQGSSIVNSEIARWLAQLRAEEAKERKDESSAGIPEIPPQSAAPVETEIVENQVRRRQIPTDVNLPGVAPSHNLLRSESEFLAGRLGGQLPDTGSVLDKCHTALGNTLENMQIYQVGYWSAALQQMAARIDESMLDDAAGRFAGFLINLKTFAEQHEEWMAYSAKPDRQTIAEATDSAALENLDAVAENISEFPEIVDTPVANALADMKQAMSEAQQYNGETLYGFVYSVANVVQSLAKLAIDLVPEKVRKKGLDSVDRIGDHVVTYTEKGIAIGAVGSAAELLRVIGSSLLGLSGSYPTVFGWVKPLLAYLGLQ